LLKSLKNKLCEPKPGFRRHSPEALYILKQGQLESYRSSQTNSALALASSQSLTYRSWCWISQFSEQLLPAQTVTYGLFRPLNSGSSPKPEITGVFTPDGSELSQLTSALSYEQERQLALRPYLVTRRNEVWGQVAMPCVCASKLDRS